MSSNRKLALLIGAATCLLAMMYTAPIFGADDPLMAMRVEVGTTTTQDVAAGAADNEAMMRPLRQQASAALMRLELASSSLQ